MELSHLEGETRMIVGLFTILAQDSSLWTELVKLTQERGLFDSSSPWNVWYIFGFIRVI